MASDLRDGPCRLYLITPSHFELSALVENFRRALDGGEIAALQLRMKEAEADDVRRAAALLLPVCRERGTAFIVNDRPDIARDVGADGTHLGEPQDGTVKKARALLGEEAAIGYSCYASKDRAFRAAEDGADYVAFGAFYPTKTKAPKGHPTPDLLEFWSRYTTLPCVAIGGITPENCAPLVRAGADFLAVVSGVWDHHEGPEAAVRDYHRAMRAASAEMERST